MTIKTRKIPAAPEKVVADFDYAELATSIGYAEVTLRRMFSSAFPAYWPSRKLAVAVAMEIGADEADVYELCENALGKTAPVVADGDE